MIGTAAALLLTSHAAAAEPIVRVNIFGGPQNIGLLVAQEKGLFAKRGLSTEIQITPGSRVQRDGLINGSFEIAQSAVDNAVALVENENADVIIVAGGSNGMTELVVRPEINTYEDIRGRPVVVDAPDTAYGLILYKLLALRGLRKGDYTVVPAGACPQRRDALHRGGVAAMLNPPCNLLLKKEGYKSFARSIDVIGPYLADGVWVMRSWAQANGDTLVKYLQAVIEGYRWGSDPANRAAAVGIVAKYLKFDHDIAVGAVEEAVGPQGGVAKDAAFDMEGFRNTLKLRAEMAGGKPEPKPDKYIDLSYYRRALAGR